ncbi:TPA: DUF1381 domain-containing protein [Staphylococcus aureus]|nr:DUF1381 domain-containing protein [Staphylococcus aureus]HDJ5233930.1 DUF1381 domain-containing protein [Staphylococcus aureus]HEI6348092.1 DUF1381 domain-containing protein [Staphylococcus aureus]
MLLLYSQCNSNYITRSVAHMQYLLDKVVEAESKEEAKEKYEAQVKRDAIIKLGQLFENIRECGK